ncbi:MAG TPA: GAF domain-containing SpoIIE family protein phosphatase [Pyrinomonadaceae bacterium]|jgi:sigma-B regulation protein RsbU (phosphoserine phosphatase)|nr:GAF domain-containing SpoIIE family protein phosphatase [Pyrinomonadaceae bacterium]
MSEQVKDAAAHGLTTTDKLRMLLDITQRISRSLDLQEVLNLVMDTLDSLIPYDAAGIFLIDCVDKNEVPEGEVPEGEEPCSFKAEAVRGYDIEELYDLHLKLGEGFLGSVALTGKPIISNDVRNDPVYVNARDRTRSEMVAPIISNDEVIGCFDLESDELNAYGNDDLEVLMLLASQVAIIIDKVELHEQLIEKKRLQGQLEVARQVQLELLPPNDPQLSGYDISAYNFPTEEVSGDYYDWVRIYEDQIGIVIADVSGKGVPAAILMAFLRASLRAASQIGYATNISMAKVNSLLWESIERNQFVTAFYGILDATNKTLSFSNAGHNWPILIKAGGEIRFLDEGEQPLGMFQHTRYHQYHVLLEPGDVLVLYTDGASEAESPGGEEFGRERLVEAVKNSLDKPAREMIASIQMAVLEWTASAGANDDVTFFVIKALK